MWIHWIIKKKGFFIQILSIKKLEKIKKYSSHNVLFGIPSGAIIKFYKFSRENNCSKLEKID